MSNPVGDARSIEAVMLVKVEWSGDLRELVGREADARQLHPGDLIIYNSIGHGRGDPAANIMLFGYEYPRR